MVSQEGCECGCLLLSPSADTGNTRLNTGNSGVADHRERVDPDYFDLETRRCRQKEMEEHKAVRQRGKSLSLKGSRMKWNNSCGPWTIRRAF